MSISFIRSELDQRLRNWASSQTPPIPIAFERVPFDKQGKDFFLESFLLPAPTINPSLSGVHKRLVGIYQVNVWVKDGGEVGGSGRSDRLAQQIIDLFPVIPKWSRVSVDQTPSSSRTETEDGWAVTPVTIQYRLETV